MPKIEVREPRTYSKDSPHSYFADVARAQNFLMKDHAGAKERLARHAVELQGELRSNISSRESRYIMSAAQTSVRSADPRASQTELRGMTTGSGSGLSFVTPEYIVQQYRLFREYPPAVMEQLPVQHVPEYGMTINLPALTGPAAVAVQTEGTSLTETDPTGSYLTAALSTFAGQITVSQQLIDRAGPSVAFDQVCYAQMRQEFDGAIDLACINAATAGASTIVDSTVYAQATFIPNLFGDLYNAGQKLETAAGTKLRPTHAFFMPTPWNFIASQTGTDVRPILLPNSNPNHDMPMRKSEDDPAPGGYTGYNFGNVPAFVDGNIPAVSGNAQIVVLNSSSIYPFDGDPIVTAWDKTLGNQLQVVIRMHGYAGFIVVFPLGVCQISGAAYSTAPTFLG